MKYSVVLDRNASDASLVESTLTVPFGVNGSLYKKTRKFLRRYVGLISPSNELLDLVDLGVLIYYLDKYLPRGEREKWVRDISISIPLRNPDAFELVKSKIEKSLNILTSDNFTFETIQSPATMAIMPRKTPISNPPNAVALLSGGIDSFAGGIKLLKGDVTPCFLRVNTFDNSNLDKIKDGFNRLGKRYFYSTYDIVALKDRISNVQLEKEESQRGRSFLFLTLATYFAYCQNIEDIYVNENGIMAIHIPLDPSRASSFSTKTVYPPFLVDYQSSIRQWLNTDKISFKNLFVTKTKTEVLDEIKNAVLEGYLKDTVSCAHAANLQSVLKRNKHQPIDGVPGDKHCGYCFPCMLRRISVKCASLETYDSSYCTDPFFAITQANKSPNIDFLREASSAAIGLMRFIKQFDATSDVEAPFTFSSILDCGHLVGENGLTKIIEMHRKLVDETLMFLQEEHPYFIEQFDLPAAAEQKLKQFLSPNNFHFILNQLAKSETSAVGKKVESILHSNRWALRRLFDHLDYDLDAANLLLIAKAKSKLGLQDEEQLEKINSRDVGEISTEIEQDDCDCPPISDVWKDIKGILRH